MSYTINKYYQLSNIESFKNKFKQLIDLDNNKINNLNNKNYNVIQLIIDFNLNIMNDYKDNENINKFINADFINSNFILNNKNNDEFNIIENDIKQHKHKKHNKENNEEEDKDKNKDKEKEKDKNIYNPQHINIYRFASLPTKNIEIYFDKIFKLLNKEINKIELPTKYKKFDVYQVFNININLSHIGHNCINYIYFLIFSYYDLTNKFINLIFYDESNEYFPTLYFPFLQYKDLYIELKNIKMYYFNLKDIIIKQITLNNSSIDYLKYK